jgi:spore maturation protein CgeB
MHIVIFGLSISSTWGNGHAALWRGLVRELLAAGHRVTFFERDQPFYAENRDLWSLPGGGRLELYQSWAEIQPLARAVLAEADVGLTTSYCSDGAAASALLQDSRIPLRCFYDMDTPVTLSRLAAGETVPYLAPGGLAGFDLVLSYTGGLALDELRTRLQARSVVPLYGCADPVQHHPGRPAPAYSGVLSYIGTYAADRQQALDTLMLEPARRRPADRFVIAGAQYPPDFPWSPNIFFVRHLPPAEHPAFYASSRLTLNVTRAAMARMGWCPSGRLFEAACCGTPLLTDGWDGLDAFFTPGAEIIVANTAEDTVAALDLDDQELRRIGARARERVLDEHSARRRARQMIAAFETAPPSSARAA